MPWTEPTDEQLARFACVYAFGPGGGGMADTALAIIQSNPEVRQGWLDKHRKFQTAADALADEPAEC